MTTGVWVAITVGELVALPHLQITVLAGSAGLERQVSWAHTSDLPNPWEWLSGGELLMTNGAGLRPAAAAQINYLDQLNSAGVSGLVLGLGTSARTLTAGLRRRADALSFPLLSVPYSMSFTTIARAVAHANEREEARHLGQIARMYDIVGSGIGADSSADLLGRLEAELDADVTLIAADTGAVLLPYGRQCPESADVIASFTAHGGSLPGVVHVGQSAVALPVPGPTPTAVVIRPRGARLPSAAVLAHVPLAGALDLAHVVAAEDRTAREDRAALDAMITGRIDRDRAADNLARRGIVDGLLVAAQAHDLAPLEAHRQLWRAGIPHVATLRDDAVLVAVGRATLERITDLFNVRLGVSAAPAHEALMAAEEAAFALSIAALEHKRLFHFGSPTTTILPRSRAEARQIAVSILGPLRRYDEEHDSELLDTLRAFIDADRSWTAAAGQLHIHRQTLGYRLRRIESISGRGVSSSMDVAHWWFALRADELTGDRPVAP